MKRSLLLGLSIAAFGLGLAAAKAEPLRTDTIINAKSGRLVTDTQPFQTMNVVAKSHVAKGRRSRRRVRSRVTRTTPAVEATPSGLNSTTTIGSPGAGIPPVDSTTASPTTSDNPTTVSPISPTTVNPYTPNGSGAIGGGRNAPGPAR